MERAAPVGDEEFAALLLPFAPFEPAPHLAIAVSGGADSLALALLADRWVRARGGRVTALTVDHGLRVEAAAEAAQVARWLAERGIAPVTLAGAAPLPRRDIQAQARALRYRLLEGWCAEAGVLHLLIAHHQEDQAETLLLRLGRGSGLAGLAGMAPVTERASCRLLRPLLDLPRARLQATLTAAGQPWIADPSNRNPAYARVRLRQGAALLAAEGLTSARLAATAARLGRARAALEAMTAALLADSAWLDPRGFAWLDAARLRAAPAELGLRALAALLTTIGGAEQPPRLAALERLYLRLPDGLGGGRTLGGCRLLPRRQGVLICREPAALAPPVAAPPGVAVAWDGRFRLRLPETAPAGLSLGALGAGKPAAMAASFLPAAARAGLPALSDATGLLAVPHLGYARPGSGPVEAVLRFHPRRPLTSGRFTVV